MGAQVSTAYKCSFAGILFPCIASVVQSFAPIWLFITLIVIGMVWTGIGLIFVQRDSKRLELQRAMDKAFGKPKPEPVWNDENIDKLRNGFKP